MTKKKKEKRKEIFHLPKSTYVQLLLGNGLEWANHDRANLMTKAV